MVDVTDMAIAIAVVGELEFELRFKPCQVKTSKIICISGIQDFTKLVVICIGLV